MLCSQILWLGWVDPTKPPDIVNGFGSSSGQRRVSFRDKVLGRDCKVLSSQGVLAEGMVADEPKAMVARGYMNNGNGSTIQAHKKRVRRDESTIAKPIVKPFIVTNKRQSRIQKEKQKVVHAFIAKHDFNNLNISMPLVFSLRGPDMKREKKRLEAEY
ncbi:hypothetical protein NC653_024480 [Populus alba x Populus x berolinensis]|uniref:Uncharacterized protein n=1 Tax=Populus alba x Populus x berolinensis TaxID=444605 RepID=A0AAD6M8W0_9ROSI|nr:hypothetical protein NC653_024480 [Populus alba x Populus x berolinensis]